jgi:aspartate ammonia-lyase
MLGARGGVPETIIATSDGVKLLSLSGCRHIERGAESYLEFFNPIDSALRVIAEAHQRSVAAGDMEFNTNMPIIFACLFENLKFIRRAIQTLREKCLEGLVVKGVEDIMSLESGILALLQPKLGYATCREIAQYAAKENHSIINILIEHGYVTKEELEKLIK